MIFTEKLGTLPLGHEWYICLRGISCENVANRSPEWLEIDLRCPACCP